MRGAATSGQRHRGWLVPGYHPEEARQGGESALANPRLRRHLPSNWEGPVTLLTRVSADGNKVDRVLMPVAGHQVAIPKERVELAFFAAMNDRSLISFDPNSLDLLTIAEPHREDFVTGGHAVYLPGAQHLLVTERRDTRSWQGSMERHHGVVTIRDAATLEVVEDFSSHGIAPHEIELLADGRHVAVANYGTINPTQWEAKADHRGGSLTVIELASGRVIDTVPASRAEYEVRHLAAYSLERIAAIQAWQAPFEDLVGELSLGNTFWEADQTVDDWTAEYQPAPVLCRDSRAERTVEMSSSPLDSRQGQSIIYDSRHDEFLATFTTSHRVLVIDGSSGCLKRVIATDKLGLRHPRGIALVPGGRDYVVSGSWNGLFVFRRGSHRPLPNKSQLDLVFFEHSHLTAC